MSMKSNSFKAQIDIIGINPFVFIPENVLKRIFQEAGKDKGAIPVTVKLNGESFTQTLVKYSSHWRLYLNTSIRKKTHLEVGDQGIFEISFDPKPRIEKMPPALALALKGSVKAALAFKALPPSHQKEIKRYLNGLKTSSSLERSLGYVMDYLNGKKPQGLHAVLRVKRSS